MGKWLCSLYVTVEIRNSIQKINTTNNNRIERETPSISDPASGVMMQTVNLLAYSPMLARETRCVSTGRK